MSNIKTCTRCGADKPLTSYHKRNYKSGNVGRQSYCKKCRSTQTKERREKNKRKYASGKPDTYKNCNACNERKHSSEFYLNRTSGDGLTARCKACRRKYVSRRKVKLRMSVIEGYGGACTCCGESTYEFLTVEHKNGRDEAHADRQYNVSVELRRIIKDGFPEDTTVLCMNCNFARGAYGYCPHNNSGKYGEMANEYRGQYADAIEH